MEAGDLHQDRPDVIDDSLADDLRKLDLFSTCDTWKLPGDG